MGINRLPASKYKDPEVMNKTNQAPGSGVDIGRVQNQHLPYIMIYALGTVFLMQTYLIIDLLESIDLASWANTYLPVCFMLLSGSVAYKIIVSHPLMLWSPFTWFLGANILYFGLGALVLKMGDSLSIAHVHRYYPVTESDLLRTNLLNCTGAFGVSLGLLVTSRLCLPLTKPHVGPVANSRLRRVILAALLLGVVVKYYYVLPYYFGEGSDVLPGIYVSLQQLTKFALIALIILSKRDSPIWKVVLYPLMVSELLVSVLSFGKHEILETLICILLGYFILWPTKRLILIGSGILVVAYILSVNLVVYGRGEIVSETGTHYAANLERRAEIVTRYIVQDSDYSGSSGRQSWWTRLCYSNAQTFAMRSYDSGRPGNSFELVFYVLVPRVLWPEKPTITVGHYFNDLVTGNPYSQSAPGYFAEAYWNGGWAYVVLCSLFLGSVFSILTKLSVEKLSAMQISYLPCAMIGMTIGYRPDGWFVATVVGGTALGVGIYFVLTLLTRASFATPPSHGV